MLAIKHCLTALVHNRRRLEEPAESGAFWIGVLLFHRDVDVNRIADIHRADEPQFIVTVTECERIDRTGGESDADAEYHRAMRDPLAELLRLAPFGIHMMWIEVAAVTGVDDYIGLGDGATEGLAARSDLVVFQILFAAQAADPPLPGVRPATRSGPTIAQPFSFAKK